MKKTGLVAAIAALACCAGTSYAAPQKIAISQVATAHYRCSDGTQARAVYFQLSDTSLAFVKLTLDDREYTLPNLVSGSGARYTDLREVEWWIKGNAATLNREVSAENAVTVDCQEVMAHRKK